MHECMIASERRRQGLTQADLASRAGCSPACISNIETGSRCPSLLLAVSLAAALDCSIAALAVDTLAHHVSWCSRRDGGVE